MSKLRIILTLLLASVILILVVQNTGIVTVRLLFWRFEMSRVLLILLAAVTGFLGGYVVAKFKGNSSPGVLNQKARGPEPRP